MPPIDLLWIKLQVDERNASVFNIIQFNVMVLGQLIKYFVQTELYKVGDWIKTFDLLRNDA